MVRPPCFDSNGMKKGAWSKDEDNILRAHIEQFGHSNWRMVPSLAGLARCGKSCRMRWVNYLKPGLKRGKITKHEEDLVIKLHKQLGNKWSAIAAELPGRTDNEIKNHWHAHIKKHGKQDGVDTKVIKDQMTQECVDDTEVINNQMPQEEQEQEQEQSISEFNSCMTTDHQHQEYVENPEKFDALDWVANSYYVAD